MQSNVKSSIIAGILGVFLGTFGGQNWYLGEKNKAVAHVSMASGGILIILISNTILPNVLTISMVVSMTWLFSLLTILAVGLIGASGVWGLIEGIQTLIQGDAGLAMRGYAVAATTNPPYNNLMQTNLNNVPGQGFFPQSGAQNIQPAPQSQVVNPAQTTNPAIVTNSAPVTNSPQIINGAPINNQPAINNQPPIMNDTQIMNGPNPAQATTAAPGQPADATNAPVPQSNSNLVSNATALHAISLHNTSNTTMTNFTPDENGGNNNG